MSPDLARPPCCVRNGTISHNECVTSFILVGWPLPAPLSPLSLAADSVENIMQNPLTKSFNSLVMISDSTRNHSDRNPVFLPVAHRSGPKNPGSLNDPAVFHGGAHSRF
jgi:hypothetical protein